MESLFSFLEQQVKSNQFLFAGMVGGSITFLVYSLKAIPNFIWNRISRLLIFKVTITQNDDLYLYLQRYLNHNYHQQLRAVTAHTVGKEKDNKPPSDYSNIYTIMDKIVYNHNGDSFHVYYKNRWLSIREDKDKLPNAASWAGIFFSSYQISGFLSKKAIDSLLQEVLTYNKNLEFSEKKIKLYTRVYSDWRYSEDTVFRDIDKIFLDANIKTALLADIEDFIGSRPYYEHRNIPYRRGYCLYGPPGTGKSSLISAISHKYKLNIYTISLQSFRDDEEFAGAFFYIKPSSIVLVEDIDCYFNNRETKTKVTFSAFINEISGISSKENILLFLTTNNLDFLDEALLRSGRIDMKYYIGLPSKEIVGQYINWFFDSNEYLEDFEVNFNMADLENICIQNKGNLQNAIFQLKGLRKGS